MKTKGTKAIKSWTLSQFCLEVKLQNSTKFSRVLYKSSRISRIFLAPTMATGQVNGYLCLFYLLMLRYNRIKALSLIRHPKPFKTLLALCKRALILRLDDYTTVTNWTNFHFKIWRNHKKSMSVTFMSQ